MTGLTLTLVAVALIAAALTPALIRECRRVEQERRLREWFASNPPELLEMARNFEAFAAEVGRAFVPVMRQVAQTFAEVAEALRESADRPTEEPK